MHEILKPTTSEIFRIIEEKERARAAWTENLRDKKFLEAGAAHATSMVLSRNGKTCHESEEKAEPVRDFLRRFQETEGISNPREIERKVSVEYDPQTDLEVHPLELGNVYVVNIRVKTPTFEVPVFIKTVSDIHWGGDPETAARLLEADQFIAQRFPRIDVITSTGDFIDENANQFTRNEDARAWAKRQRELHPEARNLFTSGDHDTLRIEKRSEKIDLYRARYRREFAPLNRTMTRQKLSRALAEYGFEELENLAHVLMIEKGGKHSHVLVQGFGDRYSGYAVPIQNLPTDILHICLSHSADIDPPCDILEFGHVHSGGLSEVHTAFQEAIRRRKIPQILHQIARITRCREVEFIKRIGQRLEDKRLFFASDLLTEESFRRPMDFLHSTGERAQVPGSKFWEVASRTQGNAQIEVSCPANEIRHIPGLREESVQYHQPVGQVVLALHPA